VSTFHSLFSSPGASHFLPEGTPSGALLPWHPHPLEGWAFPGPAAVLNLTGTGIFTGCPSPTPLGLGLGPTNPTRTDLPSEPLDLRRPRFSLGLRYSCRHSHSCTLQQTLPICLHRLQNAPLPLWPLRTMSPASVLDLSPVPFSAQSRSTSELLRTLSRMAASKPTSWLSQHDHLVSHLVEISGP
jgi:hypothetical protein